MISDIDPQYFLEGGALIVENEGIFVPYFAESVRPKGSTSFLIKISGIDSEEAASELVNKEIYILKKDAEELLEDEFDELAALVGYKLIDADSKEEAGEITGIDDSTVNVLFIVETPEGEEIYVPANEELIKEIDDDASTVEMILPEGLLNINSKDSEEDRD